MSVVEILQLVNKTEQELVKNVLRGDRVVDLRFPQVIFRGHKNQSYKLVASACRGCTKSIVVAQEKMMLEKFKSRLSLRGFSNWELLALAQHYGMKTRMLDWTSNIYVALWFASESSEECDDGCVWLLAPPSEVYNTQEHIRDPFPRKGGHDTTKLFRPFIKSSRIISQSGLLMRQVFEAGKIIPVDENEIFRGRHCCIMISNANKKMVREFLQKRGVYEGNLFPFDGILEDHGLTREMVRRVVDEINER